MLLLELQLVSKDLQKIADFQTKKSVHVSMTKSVHGDFRKALFDYDLSMQEVLELFATLVSENDDRAIDIIKEAKHNKRSKVLSRLKESEVEDLYDTISQIDPFSRAESSRG